jgi:diacylglycerol kinase
MKKFLIQQINSFRFALRGIYLFFKNEIHAKIHLLAVILVTFISIIFKISALEWCLVLLCFALVLTAEIINSAIENAVDLASPELHPLAEKAKDLAAGAVLIASICSVIIAILIFIPKFFLPK